MRRLGVACGLLVLLFGSSIPVDGQADDPLAKSLILQKANQKIIAQAEPAIACILVSRSDGYRRIQQPPSFDSSGRLGDFNPDGLDDLVRRKLDLADPNHVPEAYGSGVVVDPAGLVLTNYHVVRDATKVFVRLPGNKSSYADIHAADARSDLAVLKLRSARILPLKAIAMGDAGLLERGQFLLSLANPFAAGFRDGQPSASWGILSNMRRRPPGQFREEERTKPLHYYGTLLQTDARLHLGSSGGALLNLKGELVGLTTAFAAIQGGETPGGFAIPIDAGMRRIIDVLKRGEEVDYGFLGISFKEFGGEPVAGVPVGSVLQGSPAEGRLHANDIILAVDGIPVNESDDLFLHIGTQLAGNKVKLHVRRPGEANPINVEVTLAKFHVNSKKVASSTGKRPFFRGLRVDYTSLLAQQPPRQPRIPPGVLISEVQPGGPAALAQLKAGEIITHVNDRAVTSPAHFYQTVADLKGPVEFRLFNEAPQGQGPKVVVK